MSWIALGLVLVILALAVAARRHDLLSTSHAVQERDRARRIGSDKARLAYPDVDLARCIGCGLCVQACPEEGVLALVHGQALVVHGARCVGHGRCASACPVGAIALTFGDLAGRKDIPVLSDGFESTTTPGLFLAGEVTGYALVRTAIAHGVAVAEEVARRVKKVGPAPAGVHDLVIVGAGPAGLACALQARLEGLDFVVVEQEALGGTVARYPRRKLVMTQPVELPGVGRLDRKSYTKEELMALWEEAARDLALPVRTGQVFTGVEREPGGLFTVHSETDTWRARQVCLALGRRGTPRKLGVPGEDLSKVAYSLLDAQAYRGRRILVVGGGDSAVEAALGLAEQPGNEVVVSYRREAFFRLKTRNERHLAEALEQGRLRALMTSEVLEIQPEHVTLRQGTNGSTRELRLDNDDVFVFAGGTLPFPLLERSGVSFDPAQRIDAEPITESGRGLARALLVALVLTLGLAAWVLHERGYYGLVPFERLGHPSHALLRPGGWVGLGFGVGAVLLIVSNLAYLARRGQLLGLRLGSLQRWMTVHVVTGLMALLFALVHAGMAPRATVGGHALAALGVLIVTGAIGRYFYALVPRAANGRELALEEVGGRLAALSGDWDRENRAFGERVRTRVQALVTAGGSGSYLRRVAALLGGRRALRATLDELEREGRREGIAGDQLREILGLARRAHRMAWTAAHFEELRALMASWRYLHRWVALYMVLIVVLHVIAAVRYGGLVP